MYEDLIRELSCCPDAEYGCSTCKFNRSLNCREKLMQEAADAIEKLLEKLANKTKWVSVNDWMPPEMEDKTPLSRWSREVKPSDDVLIWLTVEKRQTVAWYSYEKECWTSVDEKTNYLPREVSHWMPLPEPPREEGGEDV